jgi:hypothetical protein
MGAIHHHDFLMQGLNGMMDYAVRTVIQYTGHAYLPELLLRLLRFIVQKQLGTVPDQCFHLDTLADGVIEYCLHDQIVSTPEVNLSFFESLCTKRTDM